jgi:hypothetical protein
LFGTMMSGAFGFSLDAAGYGGAELVSNPLSMQVPGYGELVMDDGFGNELVLGSAYGNGPLMCSLPLSFDGHEAVKISFGDSSDADRDEVGAGVQASPEAKQAGGDDAEPVDSVWGKVPEPASAGLGLIGLLLLLLGRRR